jgi:Calcineurin-like phosphoesterase
MNEAENDQPMSGARFARLLVSIVLLTLGIAVLLLKIPRHNPVASAASPAPEGSWRFIVSGDSRNCGDIIMPAMAAQSAAYKPSFYWHLGDLRMLTGVDQDMQNEFAQRGHTLACEQYRRLAWPDYIDHQLTAFEGNGTTVYVGIGNHETVLPKTTKAFENMFADWLSSPTLVAQRTTDGDPDPTKPHTYFHWIQGGVDFIYLDNSCGDYPGVYPVNCDFFPQEVDWFDKVIARAKQNPDVRSVVVGMHEPLPDSLAANHAMCDTKTAPGYQESCDSGRHVYDALLDVQKSKPVYVIASHQHFYMPNIYGDLPPEKRLPGWIVGSAGAQRYALPNPHPEGSISPVYGYLLGTVSPDGKITFEFKEVKESDVPAYVRSRYAPDFVPWCFAHNSAWDTNKIATPNCVQEK